MYINCQRINRNAQIAKIFMRGRNQAVCLPKEFHFDTDEVYIDKQGDNIIISPKKLSWDEFFDAPSPSIYSVICASRYYAVALIRIVIVLDYGWHFFVRYFRDSYLGLTDQS